MEEKKTWKNQTTWKTWSKFMPVQEQERRKRDYNRNWKRENPDWYKAYHRMKAYGLGPGDWAALQEESDGLCALCYERSAKVVDHDHKTGQVRGALCYPCNGALGQWGDDFESVFEQARNALDYLSAYEVA